MKSKIRFLPQTGALPGPLRLIFLLLVMLPCFSEPAARAIGQPQIVSERPQAGDFCLFAKGGIAGVLVDPRDHAGVLRVARDLQTDLQRVSDLQPAWLTNATAAGPRVILVGTIGKSEWLDQLIQAKQVDVSGIAGQWEASVVQTVAHPWPGVANALVIAGSDKRGTIFGVYGLSEQLGVSPWHWWADVPPRKHRALYVQSGRHPQASPAVKYRGIFINDEGPCLMTWARTKYGELNHQMYTNVFELILRLRGNYLWPAMWDNSFATDDPWNAKLADEYGVVISTSHHEPLMRAWKEWERAGHRKGSWDYSKNEAKLREFWTNGLLRTKDFEKVITIGMRGDGDEPMSETESVKLLERIVADQRQIIGGIINPDVTAVPQVWALYKEVQGYYERGMRVPDDVTLLWCDDNWGNLRRLPTEAERRRSGGAGIYYHLDYVGGPRNYKWLNTVPLPKIQEQMNLAWHYGANRLWIVNVGDIKPEEVPLEFFLALAWNPEAWSPDRLGEYLRLWAEREFGAKYAAPIADLVAKYAKYNGRRKPELLDPATFSLENYGEADRVLREWHELRAQAEAIDAKLPPESRDAFYQLVRFPITACAVVNELYIAAAQNHRLAARNDPRANAFAARVRELFEEDAALSDYYNHKLAGGKWNHMMDQTHIGYTMWQQPPANIRPRVLEVTNAAGPLAEVPTPEIRPKSEARPPRNWHGFAEAHGYIAMEAEHYSRKQDSSLAHWTVLPDHGRTLSAMTILPVTAPSVASPRESPVLEYRVWLGTTGAVEVTSFVSPCLNFSPERGVRLAVAFDGEPPRILTIVPKGYTAGDGNRDWEESVKDSVRKVKSRHTLTEPGAHIFKIWMLDPAVVLQKIVVDCGGLKPSYLGPPESERR